MSSVIASTVSIRVAAGSLSGSLVYRPSTSVSSDEEIGLDERGDQRAQVVVVADLDLLDGNGVVLVDDGQHAELEQGEQRVARVQIARPIGDVLRRQQHLPDRHAVALERDLVVPHQRRLADGGRRLLLGNRARPLGEREARHAGRDRARA